MENCDEGMMILEERKEKSFKNKRELIDAAIKEFSERGYDNASLNNILKEAQISKGTFYYHFTNKEDLYFYLIDILIGEKKKFFSTNIDPDIYQKNIFDLLKFLTHKGIKFAQEHPHITKFSASYIKERGNEIYEKALKRYNYHDNDFINFIIENAYNRGELREDLSIEFVKNLVGYLFTHIVEIANIVDVDDVHEAATNLIDFIKNGLAKR